MSETYIANFHIEKDLVILNKPSVSFLKAIEKITDNYVKPSAIELGCDLLFPRGEIRFNFNTNIVSATVFNTV